MISDAHGHAAALRRGLDVLQRAGAEQIIFLGDAVGYIPTLEAVDVVEDAGLPTVRGNHEEMLLAGTTPVDRDAVYGHAAASRSLDASRRARLKAWPTMRFLDDGAVLAIHGSPTDPIAGYVYPDTPLDEFASPASIVVMGHTHRPFVRRVRNVLYVNAGSCALPRDTGGFGAVALVDTRNHVARILRFDVRDLVERVVSTFAPHDDVVRAMRRPVSEAMEGEVVPV